MNIKNKKSLYLAEFIGTFFLVFFGCGSMILAETSAGHDSSFIPIIWGGVVSIMIYSVGHISGAHFNPAVTFAFWMIKKFPRDRLIGYLLSQFSGAIFASMIHIFIWGESHSFGATSFNITMEAAFVVEVILSFILMFVIVSVATDSRAVGELAGIAIGTTVALCAFVGGPLTKASMNPARSLGPALISGQVDQLWLYFIAPLLGAILGALTYQFIRCENKSKASSKEGSCC